MMKTTQSQKLLLALLTGYCLDTANAAAQSPPVNIALGKRVAFSAPPNYSLTNDPDDIKQLTDGKYSSFDELQQVENASAIWLKKGTVGWSMVMPLVITIDLGSVQPIAGASYSTAAGVSDVAWPRMIFMAVSDDQKIWHSAGELIHLSHKNGLPPETGYANHRFATDDLRTKGRYVAFGVVQLPYAFVDEIEIHPGDDAWLSQPAGGRLIPDFKNWMNDVLPPALVLRRVQLDASAVKAEVDASQLSMSHKNAFAARLHDDVAAAAKIATMPPNFKAILPLNEQHRDVLSIHGELLAAKGFKPLTVWQGQRYQWLPLLATPPAPSAQSGAQLHISMLRNQFRADALLLTNASGKPQSATLQLKAAPPGAQAGWLKISSVAWTDTAQSVPVADALLPIQPQNGGYRIEIPAGMTRKVWLAVDSSKLPAGEYQCTVDICAGAQPTSVPFIINVASLAMEKPRLALGVWDYTNTDYAGLTPRNRAAALELMRSHYVDTTWASGAALPRPEAADFDAHNQLKAQPDFSNFDQWVALWPEARRYFVFLAVGDTCAGAKMGTPEFKASVGSWVKTLAAHMEELGKKPRQLGLLLVDEPFTDEQDAIIAAWAHAINATAPELTLFEDPIWARPDQTKIQDAITAVDVLCFHLPVFKAGGPEVKAYAKNLLQQGKELWLYQATGPIRLYDPQLSYRQLAWHTYSIGGTGEGFWAFADTGGMPTSWDEYAASHLTYAPVFIDRDTVYSSLHWEAVREGIQDYEELAMLQDAIHSSQNAAWKQQAQGVLDGVVKAVAGTWDGDRDWQKKTDADLTDDQLQKVRHLLIRSSGN